MSGKFEGEITGLTGHLLHGWAWQPEAPDERVVVEVYLNGYSLGVTLANTFEPELADKGIGDGVHGFSFGLPDIAREEGGTLRARIANTDCWFDSAELDEEETERLDSQVFTDGGLRLTGWAQELGQVDKALTVQFSSDDGVFIEQVADRYNAHAAPKHKHCGFDVTLPLALADGRAHEITVTTDEGKPLKGSPVTIACYPEGDAGYFREELAKELPDDERSGIFAEMLHENRHYTPRSVGFELYPQWFELFGGPRHKLRERRFSFGLRWVGIGDRARTEQSLAGQTHKRFSFDQPGKYTALIGAGDTLPPWALAAVADALSDGVGMLYTDCDRDDAEGKRAGPWFKPAWDPDLLCQQNYLAPLCVIAGDIVKKFADAEPEALPYLAAIECIKRGKAVKHLPLVCYHRRHQGQDWEHPEALGQLRERLGWDKPLAEEPLVSIIVPTRDQLDYLQRCVESVQHSSYKNIELIVVDNQSSDEDAVHYLAHLRSEGVKVLFYDHPFNFAAINNFAVAQASGEIICLLNNDVEVISPDWLEQMLRLLLREDTGAVGAKLLWPNRMVQHGGVLLGQNKVAGHYGDGCMMDDAGYFDHNQTVRRVAGVTAACLLMRRDDFETVGGFNEIDFPVGFNDVDLCLKLRQQLGKAIVWTPHARLFHYESASRGKEDRPEKQARALREIAALRKYWGDELLRDPAYNPNLNLDALAGAHTGLALPPRERLCR